jgi:hypothetical protein
MFAILSASILQVCVFSCCNSQCPSHLAVRVHLSWDAEKMKRGSHDGDFSSKESKRGYSGAYGGA